VPTLVIHPGADPAYASLVLEGLAAALGERALRFGTEGFPRSVRSGRVFACYVTESPERRAFLGFHDRADLDAAGLEWATVYGAVNVRPEDAPGRVESGRVESGRVESGRVDPLGPLFGIRLRSQRLMLRHHAARLRHATRPRTPAAILGRGKAFVEHERRRTTIDRYRPVTSDPDYIFYIAWPWAKHPEVNPPRVVFIEACRDAPGLAFEGGFAPRRRDDVAEVLPFSAKRRYPIGAYLARVGRSAVAFNNPAVHGCLGWKLGEFLALGKAIVSLPLDRALPAPLEHGEHLHLVDGSRAAIDDALDRLRRDHPYRQRLERNARAWYERHLAPDRLALDLLDGLGIARQ
jgi:hypothetical protein